MNDLFFNEFDLNLLIDQSIRNNFNSLGEVTCDNQDLIMPS
jgi:hypothetical protein